MIQEFLASLTPQVIENEPFPLQILLEGSLYYPASGVDGTPIRHHEIGVDSYVYADWGLSQAVVEDAPGPRGYHILGFKHIGEIELTPNGWDSLPPPTLEVRFLCMEMHELFTRMVLQDGAKPFALWYVFERDEGLPENHGPARFSLMFIRAEACAAYQALYTSNSFLPKVVALIRPGTGLGGNYSNFVEVFLEVLQENPRGLPPQLLAWHPVGDPPTYLIGESWSQCYPNPVLRPLSKDGEFDKRVSLLER